MRRANSLQDKRVIVLGGSSGIGLAVAEQAASQGASVIIASSSAERVQKAVESIGGEAQGQAGLDVLDGGGGKRQGRGHHGLAQEPRVVQPGRQPAR